MKHEKRKHRAQDSSHKKSTHFVFFWVAYSEIQRIIAPAKKIRISAKKLIVASPCPILHTTITGYPCFISSEAENVSQIRTHMSGVVLYNREQWVLIAWTLHTSINVGTVSKWLSTQR
jgi:hypothetical protein